MPVGAGRGRSGPVGAGAGAGAGRPRCRPVPTGADRYRPVPVPRRDRKKRCNPLICPIVSNFFKPEIFTKQIFIWVRLSVRTRTNIIFIYILTIRTHIFFLIFIKADI